MPKRQQQIEEELEKQHTRESIRVTFANKANEVGPYLEGESEKLAAMAVNVQGSLEVSSTLQTSALQLLHALLACQLIFLV